MKLFSQGFKLLLVMTLLTGVLYPLAITFLGQKFFPFQANGSMMKNKGIVVGSALLAQKFERPDYFWPRPSSVDYNPIPSGATNLGPISSDLKKQIEERKAKYPDGRPPQDLLTSSGSGLDPHISPEGAYAQIYRVARARNLGDQGERNIRSLIDSLIEKREFGVLGEPRVNVLKLNLALEGR